MRGNYGLKEVSLATTLAEVSLCQLGLFSYTQERRTVTMAQGGRLSVGCRHGRQTLSPRTSCHQMAPGRYHERQFQRVDGRGVLVCGCSDALAGRHLMVD